MLTTTKRSRLLRSRFVDLLVGPHGIDRYLELIDPQLTVRDARAKVTAVRCQTDRSVTVTLAPNGVWPGFRAGQFLRVGVEIDGVRRTRTYSPASSEHGRSGELELTITEHPTGLVSRHLRSHLRVGSTLHLGPAQGDFVLPDRRPQRLALISGGSGITPVLSMLRTLCDEGHTGEIAFLHYARTRADWLYRAELGALASAHPNLTVDYVATREVGHHIDAAAIARLLGDSGLDRSSSAAGPTPDTTDAVRGVHAAVCGPPPLIDAVREIFAAAPDRVLAESFTPPTVTVTGERASGAIRFERSDLSAAIGTGSLLEQAEAAGLNPEFGCRMGICHSCTCRKRAGAVRNVLTGAVSAEEDEEIQLCISVPAGDVALEL